MPWGRRTQFFGTLAGMRQNDARVCGDKDSGLAFEGGGWAGFVTVECREMYDDDGELVDWVNIRMISHPQSQEDYRVELYSGPLDASKAHERKRKLRRRRALDAGKQIARDILTRTTSPVYPTSGEDLFFYDELEENDG